MADCLLIVRAPKDKISGWPEDRVWCRFKPAYMKILQEDIVEIGCADQARLRSMMSARTAGVDVIYSGDMLPEEELVELLQWLFHADI
mgnify:CR=1 FL=1